MTKAPTPTEMSKGDISPLIVKNIKDTWCTYEGIYVAQVNGELYHPLYMYIYWARKQVLKRGSLGQSQEKMRCMHLYQTFADPRRNIHR